MQQKVRVATLNTFCSTRCLSDDGWSSKLHHPVWHPALTTPSQPLGCYLLPLSRHAQVVDETLGAATKREYGVAMVPTGDALVGLTVDFMGRLPGSGAQLGADVHVPLFNAQLNMESREQINQSLTTGVKVGPLPALSTDCPLPCPGGEGTCIEGYTQNMDDAASSAMYINCGWAN